MLHAVVAVSTIARGRVASLDVAAAKAHPGVVEVITPANRPPLSLDPDVKHGLFGFRFEALQNDRVRYAKQPIALVVAETLEAATEGARLLAPTYEAEPARIGFDGGERYDPPAVGIGSPPNFDRGDLAAGHAAATHRIETAYETPIQYHNAMEPHAIVAEWDGDRLTIDTPNQAIVMARAGFAAYFGIPAENVHLRSPFLGGGFGSKAILSGPQILCILAARMLGRPVKLVLPRDQMFGPVGHRGATQQHLRLGIDADGRLTALEHHAMSTTSSFDDFIEPAANASHNLYASPAISTRHCGGAGRYRHAGPDAGAGRSHRLGRTRMRDGRGGACLRARSAGIPPAQLRRDRPGIGQAVLGQGAARMLRRRAPNGSAGPGVRLRRGRCATTPVTSSAGAWAAHCSPRRCSRPRRAPRCAATAPRWSRPPAADMGQGAWTALAQIAADGLGLDIDKIEFRSGSSELPDGGIAGGSGHTATAGSALYNAGADAIAKLAELATNDPDSPLFGAGNAGVEARGGRLYHSGDETRSESYADILARAGLTTLEGRGRGARDPANAEARAMFSHGAVFAEVKVDPDLGQVRVTRLVGAFAAGRIINPRLARSQLYGGMIWGLSFALHEEAIHDRRTGRPMNADLAGYHIPVHADIPELEVAADRRGRSLRQCDWGSRASAKSASPAPSAQSRMRSGTRPG